MIQVNDIKPLTDFLRNAKSHITGLKRSGRPEILTVNGEAAVVVQDAKAYQQLLNLTRQAQDDARLADALEALRKNEQGIPSDKAFARLRKKHAKR